MAEDLETEIKRLYREHSMAGGGHRDEALAAAIDLYLERTGASADEARAKVEAIVIEVQHHPEEWAQDRKES